MWYWLVSFRCFVKTFLLITKRLWWINNGSFDCCFSTFSTVLFGKFELPKRHNVYLLTCLGNGGLVMNYFIYWIFRWSVTFNCSSEFEHRWTVNQRSLHVYSSRFQGTIGYLKVDYSTIYKRKLTIEQLLIAIVIQK